MQMKKMTARWLHTEARRQLLTAGMAGCLLALACVMTGCRSEPAFAPSKHVLHVESAAGFSKILQSHDVVLVDFYANWCGPCKMLKPTIHGIADQYAGRAAVVGVDVDRAGELAQQYGVRGIPDVRIFKSGRPVQQLVGLRGKEAYTDLLDALLDAEMVNTGPGGE
jgi:thioredoxin 1